MSTSNRWTDFLCEHQNEVGQSIVDRVEWLETPEGHRARVAIKREAPWPTRLEREAIDFLTAALAAPVDVVWEDGAEPEWASTVLAVEGPLKRIVRPEDIVFRDGQLLIHFGSPGARQVFDGWGGLARLQEMLPHLPPVRVEVGEATPPPPDEVVVVEAMEAPIRWGRGTPPGPVDALSDVGEDGDVVVEGRIFKRDARSLRDGSELLFLGITDNQDSITVKLLERRGQSWPGPDLQEGLHIRVAGTLERDRAGEVVLRAKDLGTVPSPVLHDGSDRPRVEWHLHTKMSAMDSLTNLQAAVELAKTLGHPALAIVDHGVVQSYPEAAALAKKTGVRMLYGLEANAVEDSLSVLSGEVPEGPWQQWPVVAVDIETTGLSPRQHDVIEIGAVRIEGGDIVDRFQVLMKPVRRQVSAATTEITGIRSEDLAAAVDAAEGFRAFNAFAQGAVLVAHNASFDLGFLREHLTWEPTVIDTLALARVTVPDARSYGLGPLTQLFRVPLSQHHRALHDAEACGRLLLALLATDAGKAVAEAGLGTPTLVSPRVTRPTPVTIFPRHQQGLRALYEAVTASHLEYFHRVPRIPWSVITAHRADWLVGSPILGGELAERLLRNAPDAEWHEAQSRYDYWEVAPPSVVQTWYRESELTYDEAVEQLLTELVERGRQADKPVVAVSDAHYLRPHDKVLRDILSATAKGDLHDQVAHLHLRTTAEMLQEMAFLGSDRAQEVVLAASHDLLRELDPAIQPVPDGLHAPKLPEAEDVVREVPWTRARECFGDPLPDLVQHRLEQEIGAILKHGYASVYYTAHRLVLKSLADGYLVGSRGSVGSSLVATYLDITEVNPLPPHYRCRGCQFHEFFTDGSVGSGFDLPRAECPQCGEPLVGDGQDIPFETFLGFEGEKVPDIDLNFSGEYQPVIHRYTEELFGQGQVFRAGTIATVAERTAFGLVKAWARDSGRELRAAEVDRLVLGLMGVKRTTGQHPGGLMVVPPEENIHRFTPVQRPADAADTEVTTTHFDYHAIEGRLLKLDLLGHEDPTALRLLGDLTGVDARAVPFQDPDTMALFSGVKSLDLTPDQLGSPVGTLGLPEFGTPFVRRMLADTRPATFAELVRISGLSHGTNVWANNADELIRSKKATLAEVIATRDDIMTYLIRRGLEPVDAFSISEHVRKGKLLKPEERDLMKAHGVPTWYIDSCLRITYLFPKAHAAAYVTMGWRIAWFKVHHPLAFYAVYCSVRAGDFLPQEALGGLAAIQRTLTRIEALGQEASVKEKGQISLLEVLREMLLRGFSFLPVSLMQSDAQRFVAAGDRQLLMPFVALPGLGAAAAHNIIEARAAGPFLSIEDLRQRAKLSKPVLDLLREFGALDDLGETRQLALF